MASLRTATMLFLAQVLLLIGFVNAVPMPQAVEATVQAASSASSDYWVANIKRQGVVAFGNSTEYQVYRNVKDFGAKGDGSTDDTDAINKAISSGNRCGKGCDSSTVTPALVYFPPGTYVVSKPVVQYYYTQMVGDAISLPVIKASASFAGMAVIDADPYEDDGSNWYTNQNNFFRAVRNFVVDLTAMPQGAGAGIHWQVGQATSLQNIRFEMVKGGGDANKQQGIFMDNGSGGFMSDLTFNGGNYGMFLGNQQFTTRNLTFNDCNTAIFMNWNWAWTFKSVFINNCQTGLNMSNSPQNQTVGSVLILDSKLTNTPTGVVTAFAEKSIPEGGGVLILDNVDFSGSKIAVANVDGSSVLEGGSVVGNWIQGNTYTPSNTPSKSINKRSSPVEVVIQTVTETVQVCAAGDDHDTLKTAGLVPTVASILFPTGDGLNQPGFSSPSSTEAPVDTPAQSQTQAAVPTVPASHASASSAVQDVPAQTSTVVAGGSGSTGSGSGYSGSGSTGSTGSGAGSGSGTGYSSSSPSHSNTPIHSTPIIQSPAAAASSSAAVHGSSNANSGTCSSKTVTKTRLQTILPAPAKPSVLIGSNGIYERSKPLYTDYSASSFVSVKSSGAKGDGQTDDTAAIQKIFDAATTDQIIYFDHGSYIITDTVRVPKNIKITGEIWPVLMAHGDKFSDESNPIPMLQVGQPGDKGSVEISDIAIQTKGPAPGAILMQWNVAEETQGSVGMWDVHFRIGGSAGTQLQSDTCAKTPKQTTSPDPSCIAAFMLLHITEHASAYIENAWFWTADHELDLPDHNQINIYNGRGVLIESQNAVWLYGTASEHNQLYNYQISNAKNVFMGLIQSETPYYQSNPNALTPFKTQSSWNDPDFSYCTTDSCRKAWGLRVLNSSDAFVYGAGLYSFFENYEQTCLDDESCQENMVQVDCSDVHIYGLSTKASVNMITGIGGESLVPQSENESNFCSTIALFEQYS